MIDAIYKRFIPNKVVVFRPSSEKETEAIVSLIPFIKKQLPLEGKATAYICENYACRFPTTSLKEMQELLDEK